MQQQISVNGNEAFGVALRDYLRGITTHYIVEREDGHINPASLSMYFADYPEWPAVDIRMQEFVHGRVLDVGCGAGRHALHLQDIGFDVVGMDRSSIAVEVAKQRGVRQAYAASFDEFLAGGGPDLGVFDSIIMMGHNIGLLHGFDEGRKMLKQLARITSPDARIIGTSRAAGRTDDPDHLAYQEKNRERGRMPGQLSLRVRHRTLASDWMDYLILSEDELRQLVEGTGWRLETTIEGDGGFGGTSYLAVLSKQ